MKLKNIGRYEIIGELGRGGMGVVLKGKDPAIGRVVAIKILKLLGSNSEVDTSFVERFYQEARIVGKLTHPNITMIHDVGDDQGNHYIVMEYLEGVNLEHFIAHNKSGNLEDKIRILIQIAKTLHYAHSMKIVHRDIKPANIMLMKDLQVKIMDFGIGKMMCLEEFSLQTQAGHVVGTPAYMSPEQLCGKEVDGQTDIYSMGVLGVELLTGEKLYKKSPPYQLDGELPESLCAIMLKSVEKNKEKRFLTACEFADALEIYLEESEKKITGKQTEQTAPGRDLVAFLKKNYRFFWDFSDADISKIFKITKKEVYRRGELVFKEGTVGSKMYIIISGSVKVTKLINNQIAELNTLGPGDCFGEMSLIGNSILRFATVSAKSDSVLLAINEAILRNSEPCLCVKLYKNLSAIMCEKLKKTDLKVNTLNAELENLRKQQAP